MKLTTIIKPINAIVQEKKEKENIHIKPLHSGINIINIT
jgi:hypothetical protein